MICVVQKSFAGSAGVIASGTILDTTGARNERRLISCRFLRPATEQEIVEAREGGKSISTVGEMRKARQARASAPRRPQTGRARGAARR